MGVPLSKLEAMEERISRSERSAQKSRPQMSTLSAIASRPSSSKSSNSSSKSYSSDTMSAPGKLLMNDKASVNAALSQQFPTRNERQRSQSNVTPTTKNSSNSSRPSSTPPPLPERPRYSARSGLAEGTADGDSGISFYPASGSDAKSYQRSAHSQKKAQKVDEEELLKRAVFDHNNEHEYNRQLRQHYVFKQVFGNVSVTFDEPPTMILDSASGAGFWALDLAQEYPDAKVISLDISFPEAKPPRSNIIYKIGNIMSPPLPFASNTFDFVYQRDVGSTLPLLYWQPLIADFYRILKPNGLVQLVEHNLAIPCFGPCTQAVNKVIEDVIRVLGFDPHFTDSLCTMLHLAGFTNVERQIVQIPLGEWPEDKVGRQQGFLNRELIKGLFRSFRQKLSEHLGLKSDDYEEYCAAMIREMEENKGSSELKIFTARKP